MKKENNNKIDQLIDLITQLNQKIDSNHKEIQGLKQQIEENHNTISKLQDKLAVKNFNNIDEFVDELKKTKKVVKDFYTYSLSIDKNDYDIVKKVAKAKDISVSALLKEYYQRFIHGGPNVYNVEYPYMISAIANRKLAGAKKSIAFAINYEENQKFKLKLKEWDISKEERRNITKFFVTQIICDYLNIKVKGKWEKCVSSHIKAYSYDEDKKILYIQFKGSDVYAYYKVPKEIYEGLAQAPSKGVYHNKYIINKFDDKRV